MVSQYLLRVLPMIMIGYLSKVSLSSASISTSLYNVTGYNVLFGMCSSIETVFGQAYEAEQYQKFWTFTCSVIIWLSQAHSLIVPILLSAIVSVCFKYTSCRHLYLPWVRDC